MWPSWLGNEESGFFRVCLVDGLGVGWEAVVVDREWKGVLFPLFSPCVSPDEWGGREMMSRRGKRRGEARHACKTLYRSSCSRLDSRCRISRGKQLMVEVFFTSLASSTHLSIFDVLQTAHENHETFFISVVIQLTFFCRRPHFPHLVGVPVLPSSTRRLTLLTLVLKLLQVA